MTSVTSSSVTISKVRFCLRPFFRPSNAFSDEFWQYKSENWGKRKFVSRFCSEFYLLRRAYFLQRRWYALSSAFSSNQNPAHFLEKSLNSRNYTARLDLYGGYRQSSIEVSFKYNIFEMFHCVFFHGSVVYKATLRPGSPSSICRWAISFLFFSFLSSVLFLSFSFSFLFFLCEGGGEGGAGVGCCCLFGFIVWFFLFFPLFWFSFIPTAHRQSDLHEVLWYTYFSFSS